MAFEEEAVSLLTWRIPCSGQRTLVYVGGWVGGWLFVCVDEGTGLPRIKDGRHWTGECLTTYSPMLGLRSCVQLAHHRLTVALCILWANIMPHKTSQMHHKRTQRTSSLVECSHLTLTLTHIPHTHIL